MDNAKRKTVTVVIARDLWLKLKYEALRRQTTLKRILADALEQALEKWRKDTC